jgi:DEAD/DEAH box helicase domain-containing protein
VTQVRSPHAEAPTIYLYEGVPGGVGLAERLWARHAELVGGAADLVAACDCESGCPSCTGPRPPGGDAEVNAKILVLRLLAALGAAGLGNAPGGADPAEPVPQRAGLAASPVRITVPVRP